MVSVETGTRRIRVDDLVERLKSIFSDRQDRIAMCREFESQIWKSEETVRRDFPPQDYLSEQRLYRRRRVDGILDHSLRNYEKLQKLKSQQSLLEAFKGVTLAPTASEGARSGADARGQN